MDWPDPTHQLPYPFWGGLCWTNTDENKNKIGIFFQKKKNLIWGLTHPPTSEFLSDSWIFFNLTTPLR